MISKITKAFRNLNIPDLEINIIKGAADPAHKASEDAALLLPGKVRFLDYVDDMPGLFARADLAISAGGSTCWEMAFMGLPNIIIVLADNQKLVAEALNDAGSSLNLGLHHDLTHKKLEREIERLIYDQSARKSMSRRGQDLVDGRGVQRVLDSIQSLPDKA